MNRMPLQPTLAAAVLALLTSGCVVTGHAIQPGALGTASSTEELLKVIDQPGPVALETVASVDWEIDRGGLINLDDPKAQAAGLKDGPEPIQVFFHVLRHPTRGTFLVDTGMENALRDHPDQAAIRGMVASYMHLDRMKFHAPLGEWLAAHPADKPAGVLFTHLHLDHLGGAADLPKDTPLFTGPGEGGDRGFLNLFVQASSDRALEGKPAISELPFKPDPSHRFEGVLDVFGDGSVWALWVPGHTPGSLAYVVRTPQGPVLLTGDTCHTRWGWEHGVAPGSFSGNRDQNLINLLRLKQLAAEHPAMDVRFGHQR